VQYKQEWLNYVSRIDDIRYQNISLTIDLSEEGLDDYYINYFMDKTAGRNRSFIGLTS